MMRLEEIIISISVKQTGTYFLCKANASIRDQTSRGSVVVSQLEIGLHLFMGVLDSVLLWIHSEWLIRV